MPSEWNGDELVTLEIEPVKMERISSKLGLPECQQSQKRHCVAKEAKTRTRATKGKTFWSKHLTVHYEVDEIRHSECD